MIPNDPTLVGRNLQQLLAWNAIQQQHQQQQHIAAAAASMVDSSSANPNYLAMAAVLNLPHLLQQQYQQHKLVMIKSIN